MRKNVVSAIALLLLVFLGSWIASGQVAGSDTPACNAKFAQLLVESQVMESRPIDDLVKRIKILLRSADFLWKLDQPTARTYFSQAWKLADDRFKEIGFERKEHSKATSEQLPDQRMLVLKAIAKHDREWAKKLSDQMLADLEKAKRERKPLDEGREESELLALAVESARTDPDFSQYLFRRVMKRPLNHSWFFAFHQLAAGDKAFADGIYDEALRNYRNELPRRLLYLSAYPFAAERILGYEKYNLGVGRPDNMRPNPALERLFLDILFTRIASFAASEAEMNRHVEKYQQPEAVYMASALDDVEPILIQRHPDLLPRLGVARSQAVSLLDDAMRKAIDEKSKWNSSVGQSFEDRLAALKKAESDGKLTDFMIVQLVTWQQKTDEQFEEVEPWLEKVKEDKVRADLTNYFWFLRAKLAIKDKRLDDAEEYAAKVPEIADRALVLFDLATLHASNESDVPALFDTLNRLSKLVRAADNSVSKAQMLLGLANMYERVNHSVALGELSESIRVTNKLKDPDIFSSYVVRNIVGKDFAHMAMYSTPGYNLEKTFIDLSKKDFEMSLAHARSLDDKYFRTIAVIAVAKNCVDNAPPVTSKPKN